MRSTTARPVRWPTMTGACMHGTRHGPSTLGPWRVWTGAGPVCSPTRWLTSGALTSTRARAAADRRSMRRCCSCSRTGRPCWWPGRATLPRPRPMPLPGRCLSRCCRGCCGTLGRQTQPTAKKPVEGQRSMPRAGRLHGASCLSSTAATPREPLWYNVTWTLLRPRPWQMAIRLSWLLLSLRTPAWVFHPLTSGSGIRLPPLQSLLVKPRLLFSPLSGMAHHILWLALRQPLRR
mmetsp:Transcript_3549/g.6192  ORF Transcript_3549/g.6192 Transcript_3549/m.6192 type:complete len:234 (+) Transcript_3549:444-1145(+)